MRGVPVAMEDSPIVSVLRQVVVLHDDGVRHVLGVGVRGGRWVCVVRSVGVVGVVRCVVRC